MRKTRCRSHVADASYWYGKSQCFVRRCMTKLTGDLCSMGPKHNEVDFRRQERLLICPATS